MIPAFAKAKRWLLIVSLCGFAYGLHAGPIPANKPATYPGWWFERDVIPRLDPNDTNPEWPSSYLPANDYAAANLGQLKHIAAVAAIELDATLPPPWAGTEIHSLVHAWESTPTTGVNRDDFAVLNQGQLKAVADLFYARLEAEGYAGQPISGEFRPWTPETSDDQSFALVNLGQLKYVFSFDPRLLNVVPGDSDGDGLPDSWENGFWVSFAVYTGASNPDGDALTNRAEYVAGTNPTVAAQNIGAEVLGLSIYSPNSGY